VCVGAFRRTVTPCSSPASSRRCSLAPAACSNRTSAAHRLRRYPSRMTNFVSPPNAMLPSFFFSLGIFETAAADSSRFHADVPGAAEAGRGRHGAAAASPTAQGARAAGAGHRSPQYRGEGKYPMSPTLACTVIAI
jgi:hypothetical protein